MTPNPEAFTNYAQLIADLLASEETPEVLRSTLDALCTELSNQLSQGDECVCSPATARKYLPALLSRAEAAGFVCATGGVTLERGAA